VKGYPRPKPAGVAAFARLVREPSTKMVGSRKAHNQDEIVMHQAVAPSSSAILQIDDKTVRRAGFQRVEGNSRGRPYTRTE
jgi:hypothetical protein